VIRLSTIIIRRYADEESLKNDLPFLRGEMFSAPDSFWETLKAKREAVHTILENGKHVDIHVVISQERDN